MCSTFAVGTAIVSPHKILTKTLQYLCSMLKVFPKSAQSLCSRDCNLQYLSRFVSSLCSTFAAGTAICSPHKIFAYALQSLCSTYCKGTKLKFSLDYALQLLRSRDCKLQRGCFFCGAGKVLGTDGKYTWHTNCSKQLIF